MDSPHLHLGFLLLALAAPHPNIAMSNVGPAKKTENFVTVYYCKDCKSSTCSFENFQKITETKSKTSSDVIKLETNETHMTVCFEQANSYIEGMYGIFWKKAGGAGVSCGALNSGESGRGNNSTEKNVCCEIETDIWRNEPPLKCYTQKPDPKLTALPVGTPERLLGNPELRTSKKNIIGILCALLFAGVCVGCATYYFLRLRRRRAFQPDRQALDRENLTHI